MIETYEHARAISKSRSTNRRFEFQKRPPSSDGTERAQTARSDTATAREAIGWGRSKLQQLSELAKNPIHTIMHAMKSKHSFARNVLLMLVFGGAMFISTLAQGGAGYLRTNHVPPGRLTIDRAANFGWNLGFHLQIDGRSVASVVLGRSYSTWLSPGPHVLTVEQVPARGFTAPTSITVNIQPGAEHLYQAVWDSNLVYLEPAGYFLTPGAYWQNRGNGVP
jgi:hypothetical protein